MVISPDTPAFARRGFLAFDDALCAGLPGLVAVRCTAGLIPPLASHAARRATAAERALVRAGALDAADAFRDLARACGVVPADDPASTARVVVERTGGALMIVVAGSPTAWGTAFAAALGDGLRADGRGGRLLVLSEDGGHADTGQVLAIEDAMTHDERRRWWEALFAAREASVGPAGLGALERWWASASAIGAAPESTPAALGDEARRLWVRLGLARGSWDPARAARLGSAAALGELDRAGVVERRERYVALREAPEAAASDEDRLAVAAALEVDLGHAVDAWALACAAELFVDVGDGAHAEAAIVRALDAVTGGEARSDLWRRWLRAAARLPPDTGGRRALRFADRALELGDLDRAMDLAREAAAAAGETFASLDVLGRAAAARGEPIAAIAAFERASALAGDAARRARIFVEIADVRFADGQIVEAERLAREAMDQGADVATRLRASNLIGKAHLARAEWAEAERHFAADARDAVCAADLTAELRARLNAALAVMSAGRRAEARAILRSVLAEGEARGNAAAICFALANLSTLAAWDNALGESLELARRAADASARLADRRTVAQVLTSLAGSLVEVGLLDEAEHAIQRARNIGGAVTTGELAAVLAAYAARIHLARGLGQRAAAELGVALAAAAKATAGETVALCHRVAAEIALEDGDLRRAAIALREARVLARRDRTRVLCLLGDARWARAAGEPFEALAAEALAVAREQDCRLGAIQAHALVGQAAIERDDRRAAAAHLRAATELVEALAATLRPEARPAFRAKRELGELASLEATLGADATPEAHAPPPRARAHADRRAFAAVEKIIGHHRAMRALGRVIRRVADSDVTVLIHGESGTGKELVAEALHEASPRRAGPLVKVHCAALVETLLLSELFGHEKGAFTGAAARRAGRFELAEGGTLFLDEIGDISPQTQVALLRVLQERTFERVGGARAIRSTCRVVCATHRDLRAMVARGEFREDLYFRLAGIVIDVPPLRERLSDLATIAASMLGRLAEARGEPPRRLSPRAVEALSRYAWPGNVRELESAIRGAALFAQGDVIELEDFTDNVPALAHLAAEGGLPAVSAAGPESPRLAPPRVVGPVESAYAHVRGGTSLTDLKRAIERTCIERALSDSEGNISRAATLLGMKRARLSQLVKELGLGGRGARLCQA